MTGGSDMAWDRRYFYGGDHCQDINPRSLHIKNLAKSKDEVLSKKKSVILAKDAYFHEQMPLKLNLIKTPATLTTPLKMDWIEPVMGTSDTGRLSLWWAGQAHRMTTNKTLDSCYVY